MTLPAVSEPTRAIAWPSSPGLRDYMVVAFSKSSSPSYLRSVELAKKAQAYAEIDEMGKPRHFAGYAMAPAPISAALELMRLCRGIKGYNLYVNGIPFHDTFMVATAMQCFLDASRCADKKAHCNSVIRNPYADDQLREGLFLAPCSHIVNWSSGAMKLYLSHPSSPQAQIQAEAVSRGCDWCPNLKVNEFRRL